MWIRVHNFALTLAAVSALSLPVHATCTSESTDKKLAGAARTSFMTKCEHDAATSCAKTAQDKKLYGAARTSFEKKCVSDAVGTMGSK